MDDRIRRLLADSRVRAARSHIERRDAETLASQAELSAIPAPTGAEARRAARVAELLRDAGLAGVDLDDAGNVHAWLGAPGPAPVVLSAHLDTVFGPEVDVRVARRGQRLQGPGIADNARGLAALVAVAGALAGTGLRPPRPVLFAATVGEEGAGDLRGARHLLAGFDGTPPAAFIALDGGGLERVVHRALGARRYRAAYRGPGGHSWAAHGVANPAAAVGRAAALLADLPLPDVPRTTCVVVRIGGGTGINSIPQEAWLDLDLRSEDAAALAAADRAVRAALARAAEDESRRRTPGTAPVTLQLDVLGERPAGATPATHPVVRTAVAATRALGRPCELATASTDANAAVARGIPAVALGAGGRSGDAHLPTEWYDNADGPLGIVRALLVTLALAEGD